MMDHMDREPRKHLPGVTAKRRRMRGSGVTPKCGGFSRVPRIHTVRVKFMYFYCHPLHPPPFCQKGTTFLGVCSHLSPETYTKYVIQSAGYLLSHRLHRLHRFSFVLRTPNLTTTYTTYTTSNGDIVAKGRVILVVIVVLVVVNSKLLSLIINLLSSR